jgi:phosphatidylinositol alpha-1,6-mannosyltransferase
MMSAADRVLAVPLLGERSGGVGQVGTLLWRVMQQTWPEQSALVSLLRDGRLSPTLADKLGFGWSLGARQISRRTRWILFAHLGLARAERFLPEGARAPYGVFLHGVEAWRPLGRAERAVLQGARVVLANSAHTVSRTRASNPWIGEIEVCPLALADDPPAASRPSVETQGTMVLVVGRMAAGERYKGHEELIDAWPGVLAREPAAELVIVGDGDDKARLEAHARAGRAAHRIRFTGFVSRAELDGLYDRAAVFAMPSRSEGFGLVYLEAMAHYLPCLGSVHGAAGEIVLNRETGLLVDTADRHETVRAIVDLLADPELRRRMGRAGHDRWRRVFSFERFRDRTVSLLEDHLEAGRHLEHSA